MSASQFEQFGREVAAWIREEVGENNSSPWDWEYVEVLMQMAIAAGIARIEKYNPERHEELGVEPSYDAEPGDNIYLWNELPSQEDPEPVRQIVVGIENGLVQWVKPDGIPAFVHDYDIEGADEEDDILTDENGDEYFEYEV